MGVFWDSDPHVLANGFAREVEHPRWGPHWRHGPLVTFSDTPERLGAGVLASQHTNQLLRKLGYTMKEIIALRAAGAVRSEEPSAGMGPTTAFGDRRTDRARPARV
jgi:hypothetical protein